MIRNSENYTEIKFFIAGLISNPNTTTNKILENKKNPENNTFVVKKFTPSKLCSIVGVKKLLEFYGSDMFFIRQIFLSLPESIKEYVAIKENRRIRVISSNKPKLNIINKDNELIANVYVDKNNIKNFSTSSIDPLDENTITNNSLGELRNTPLVYTQYLMEGMLDLHNRYGYRASGPDINTLFKDKVPNIRLPWIIMFKSKNSEHDIIISLHKMKNGAIVGIKKLPEIPISPVNIKLNGKWYSIYNNSEEDNTFNTNLNVLVLKNNNYPIVVNNTGEFMRLISAYHHILDNWFVS